MKKQQSAGEKLPSFKRSDCPVANTLDILGDKWTLLVVRDLMLGKRTYSELQGSPEHIPTNILAERLKRLERAEIVERNRYQERPVRYAYSLTARGAELGPVLLAMVKWGNKHIHGTYPLKKIQLRIKKAKT